MTKISFLNSKGLKLVGVLHLPKQRTDRAVIISHGFTSNKDRVRLVKLAKALSQAGFTVLRFDFGGCGESNTREITLSDQVDDLKSAITYLRQKGYSKIGLIGESFGGLTSIKAYDINKVKTLVLLAPVTKSKLPSIIEEEELQQKLNNKGFLVFEKDGRKFKIPKQYFEERQSVDQKEILSTIQSPTLIIHGGQDKTVPLQQSQEAIRFLPKESKLVVIKGGNHKLDGKIDEVVVLVADWFGQYLAST